MGALDTLLATQQAPNILGAFNQGIQNRNKNALSAFDLQQAPILAQQQADTAQQQSGIRDQQSQLNEQKLAAGGTAAEKANFENLVTQAASLIGDVQDPAQFQKMIQGATFLDDEAKSIALQFGPDGIRRAAAQVAGGRPGASTRAFQPITLVNESTGEKRLVTPTFDPRTGQASLSPFDIPEGFDISKETAEEKRAADVVSKQQEKEAEITGGGIAARRQTAIQQGLDSADGFANIQRGLTLLKSVETGGIDNLQLKAKELFGIVGADEAELSNRLSKAVLSQLRATFGAAFTAAEGKQLTDIEAGFGKSTEGNIRLLEQTKRIIERSARRGIRAARAIGDQDTIDDIEESLKFSFDILPTDETPLNDTDQSELQQLRALKAQQNGR